jgi:hypothetical protein
MSTELTDEIVREWTRKTRAARGLGPKMSDRATLARLVMLALGPGPERDGKGGNGDGP